MNKLAIKMTSFFAVAFLGAFSMSIIPNPILGPESFFVTNLAHDLVHLITALLFMAVSFLGERASIRFMQVFGVFYCLVGLLGFIVLGTRSEGHLLHFIHINWLDNYLHIGLGLLIGSAGWMAAYLSRRDMQILKVNQ